MRIDADINRTNVPNIRVAFRHQTLQEERTLALGRAFDPAQSLPAVQTDPIVRLEDLALAEAKTATSAIKLADRHLSDIVHYVLELQHAAPAPIPLHTPPVLESAPGAPLAGLAAVPPAAAPPSPTLAGKRRYSVLASSVGLLGALPRRRLTSNTDGSGASSCTDDAAPQEP